jgi:hypothetical protein
MDARMVSIELDGQRCRWWCRWSPNQPPTRPALEASWDAGVLSSQAYVADHALNLGVLSAVDGYVPVLILFSTM